MIEAAAYGAAVSFGPNTKNFRDVVSLLLQADAATVVHDGLELTDFVRRCLTEPEFAAAQGRRAQTLVRQQQGAAERTMQMLDHLLGIDPAGPPPAARPGRRTLDVHAGGLLHYPAPLIDAAETARIPLQSQGNHQP